jgi:hypothetical protein
MTAAKNERCTFVCRRSRRARAHTDTLCSLRSLRSLRGKAEAEAEKPKPKRAKRAKMFMLVCEGELLASCSLRVALLEIHRLFRRFRILPVPSAPPMLVGERVALAGNPRPKLDAEHPTRRIHIAEASRTRTSCCQSRRCS